MNKGKGENNMFSLSRLAMNSCVALSAAILLGCGGGSGGSDKVEPTSVSNFRTLFSGEWILEKAVINYDNGLDIQLKKNEDVIGAMVVDGNAVGQSIYFIALGEDVSVGMNYEVVDSDTISVTTSGCTYEIDVEFTDGGDKVMTDLASGAVCGENDYRERDYWVRNTSSFRSLANQVDSEKSEGFGYLMGQRMSPH